MEPSLKTVFDEFKARLSEFGHVVIAGGAVRDTLMGRSPKDYDVFVLLGRDFDLKNMREEITPKLADLSPVKPKVEWHNSEPYLVATVQWQWAEVQILANPCATPLELMETFDWNVCLFAFDGVHHALESIENIGEGKTLHLQKVTFPVSTLRRGFRFSERFLMQLEYPTVLQLCREIVDNADAGNDIGPEGNLPDAPALEANLLVDNK